jgi:hypothetical protein
MAVRKLNFIKIKTDLSVLAILSSKSLKGLLKLVDWYLIIEKSKKMTQVFNNHKRIKTKRIKQRLLIMLMKK